MMWVAPAPHCDLTTFILLKDIYYIRKTPKECSIRLRNSLRLKEHPGDFMNLHFGPKLLNIFLSLINRQGDQIGRKFAQWLIVYFGHLF
jgi:hypothetical protein